MRLIRDFLACCFGALVLWYLLLIGIDQHQAAMERMYKPPIELNRNTK